MIWSSQFLQSLAADAEEQINADLNVTWFRFCFQVTAGQSLYTLPDYLRNLTRITIRGKKLDPMSWEELQILSPSTVILSIGNTNNLESSRGRPLYYAMHPTNPWDIRFYPTPDESYSSSAEDPYNPAANAASCIVSCFRNTDASSLKLSLPKYIDRRTRKAYVLWKAFLAEGPGQNLTASNYYQAKYKFLISRFGQINDGCYIAKKYSLDDSLIMQQGYRYPKPKLPVNFEFVEF